MKIACVSDTHGQWHMLEYPKADVLVFAGDVLGNYNTCRGDAFELHKQLEELFIFNDYCREYLLPAYKQIIMIAGNHDWIFEKRPEEARHVLKDVTYLQDEVVSIGDRDGRLIKFYGTPWQPWFWDWAFNFPDHNYNFFKARAHARETWAKIPNDVNVLITHGPPHGIMDECDDGRFVGCTWLKERLQELAHLKLHIFGHIHHSYGMQAVDNCTFVNAASSKEYDRRHEPKNPIQVVEI